jgi:hypothetical protein
LQLSNPRLILLQPSIRPQTPADPILSWKVGAAGVVFGKSRTAFFW